MQILKIPTFWSASEADVIQQFLGELQVAILREYGKDIELLYEQIREEEIQMKANNDFDGAIDF